MSYLGIHSFRWLLFPVQGFKTNFSFSLSFPTISLLKNNELDCFQFPILLPSYYTLSWSVGFFNVPHTLTHSKCHIFFPWCLKRHLYVAVILWVPGLMLYGGTLIVLSGVEWLRGYVLSSIEYNVIKMRVRFVQFPWLSCMSSLSKDLQVAAIEGKQTDGVKQKPSRARHDIKVQTSWLLDSLIQGDSHSFIRPK